MCLRRIYIYVFIFIFPIVHNFVQIKKIKRKNVNLSSRVKSANQDYGNHGITVT